MPPAVTSNELIHSCVKEGRRCCRGLCKKNCVGKRVGGLSCKGKNAQTCLNWDMGGSFLLLGVVCVLPMKQNDEGNEGSIM